MAEARRDWMTWLVVGALGLGACGLVCAQSSPANLGSPPTSLHSVEIQAPASGSLAGRLTDLHSAPLAGVSVVLHNLATGAEVHAVTARNGAFRFAELDAGEYTLEADEPQLGHGRLEGIVVTGGMEARVQAAMHFEPAAPELVEAAAPSEIATPQQPAAMRLRIFAAPAVSSPAAPALPLPTISRAALSTETPQMAALVATEPVRTMAPEPRVIVPAVFLPMLTASRAALSTSSPEIMASVAAEPLLAMEPAPIAMPSPQLRAALETQSIPVAPTLAIALPRTLPLTGSIAPTLPLNMAISSGMNAVLLLGQMGFSPVRAAEQNADPAAAVVATTVTATQLESLPAGGRRWQEFLLDTPATSAGADSTQASYRGSQESAEITIDGASATLKFGVVAGSGARSAASDPESQGAGQQNAMSQAWTDGRGFGVSEAAIHEVTATAGNVEADGMRSAGGRTGIETARGGDALHGQGFYFDRQNNWGARNPFTQWVTETSEFEPLAPYNNTPLPVFDNFQYSSGQDGLPESYTPPDHEIVWGLGMGSRIRRDKLFWFAALDSYHRNDPGLTMVKHPYLQPPCETPPCSPTGFFAMPSAAQLQLLSAQLDLPSSNPEAEGLAAYSQMLEQLASLLGPAPRTAAQWVGFGRIDWQAAERHHFTLEGTGANWNAPGGGLTQVSEDYGNHSFGSSQASEEWLLARWEAYLTPNLLAVTQGSAGRAILSARPGTPSAFESGFLNGNTQLPEMVVDSRYGFTIGNPSSFGQGSSPDEKLYHAQEMLDWVHNKVLVKAGFELDHNADATSLLRNQTGTFTYSKVENFISDALAFETFGLTDLLNPQNPHNCDVTGKVWEATNGTLMGLGALPCYSHYSQTIGPTHWNLSTNDWAGYATSQWQANKFAVFSAGLRWELEQMPPPIAALANTDLPFTGKLPSLGNNWGPRVSVAIGEPRGHWPVLRLGYGMYYGRVENATIESALTQTGSLNGDLNIFIRPTDGYASIDGTSGAPPFPSVLTGQPSSVVKPGVDGFAPNFRNPEVHQAVAAVEQPLPGGMEVTASAMLSLGRRLPVFIDANLNTPTSAQTITYDVCDEVTTTVSGTNSNGQPSNTNGPCGNLGLGPIAATQITVPFYASWPSADCPSGSQLNIGGECGWSNPDYQEIDQIASKANSTYEGAMVKLTRYGHRGLSLFAHYTYAHAMDWNPNESPLDAVDLSQEFGNSKIREYGTSNLDVRHAAAAMVIYEAPWKLHNLAGKLGNGWMVSGIGQFHSGLPYTMRVTGSLPEEFDANGDAIVGLRPGINGSGGDNRVFGFDQSGSLAYNIGRNTRRYPDTWKADLRLGKRFDMGEERQLEILAESFNLFNHQNVTEIETTGYTIEAGSPTSPPTLNFLTGLKTSSATGLPIAAFGQPLNINGSNFYRERQIQIGVRMRF
ncbi:MAG: carboxypeptidase regulatory-like domain-containing protein [Terracidiphilus sp.]